jgi:hypothetical protein
LVAAWPLIVRLNFCVLQIMGVSHLLGIDLHNDIQANRTAWFPGVEGSQLVNDWDDTKREESELNNGEIIGISMSSSVFRPAMFGRILTDAAFAAFFGLLLVAAIVAAIVYCTVGKK